MKGLGFKGLGSRPLGFVWGLGLRVWILCSICLVSFKTSRFGGASRLGLTGLEFGVFGRLVL